MSVWESSEDKKLNRIIHLLEKLLHILEIKPETAKGELNMLKVTAGQAGVVFSFTVLDQNGKPYAPKSPVTFKSSNLAVATVDSSLQVTDPTTLVTTVPVVAVAANPDGTDASADISGDYSDNLGSVTAKDTLTVSSVVVPPPTPVPTSATGVLSVTAPTAASGKNPLALS